MGSVALAIFVLLSSLVFIQGNFGPPTSNATSYPDSFPKADNSEYPLSTELGDAYTFLKKLIGDTNYSVLTRMDNHAFVPTSDPRYPDNYEFSDDATKATDYREFNRDTAIAMIYATLVGEKHPYYRSLDWTRAALEYWINTTNQPSNTYKGYTFGCGTSTAYPGECFNTPHPFDWVPVVIWPIHDTPNAGANFQDFPPGVASSQDLTTVKGVAQRFQAQGDGTARIDLILRGNSTDVTIKLYSAGGVGSLPQNDMVKANLVHVWTFPKEQIPKSTDPFAYVASYSFRNLTLVPSNYYWINVSTTGATSQSIGLNSTGGSPAPPSGYSYYTLSTLGTWSQDTTKWFYMKIYKGTQQGIHAGYSRRETDGNFYLTMAWADYVKRKLDANPADQDTIRWAKDSYETIRTWVNHFLYNTPLNNDDSAAPHTFNETLKLLYTSDAESYPLGHTFELRANVLGYRTLRLLAGDPPGQGVIQRLGVHLTDATNYTTRADQIFQGITRNLVMNNEEGYPMYITAIKLLQDNRTLDYNIIQYSNEHPFSTFYWGNNTFNEIRLYNHYLGWLGIRSNTSDWINDRYQMILTRTGSFFGKHYAQQLAWAWYLRDNKWLNTLLRFPGDSHGTCGYRHNGPAVRNINDANDRRDLLAESYIPSRYDANASVANCPVVSYTTGVSGSASSGFSGVSSAQGPAFNTLKGDQAVVVVSIDGTSATVSSLTDTVGTSYTRQVRNTGTATSVEIWSGRAPATLSSNRATVTLSATANFVLSSAAYTGVVDLGRTGTASNAGSASASVSVLTQQNEAENWIVGGVAGKGQGTLSAGTGTNQRTTSTVNGAPSTVANLPTSFTGTTTNCGNPTDAGDWSTANNAHSDTDGGAAATASPAKNVNFCTRWINFGLSIPTSAVVNNVKILVNYKVSTIDSIAELHVSVRTTNGPTNCAVQEDTSEPTSFSNRIIDFSACKAWTPADLNSNAIVVEVGAHHGGSNKAVVFSLDYVKIQVTYQAVDLAGNLMDGGPYLAFTTDTITSTISQSEPWAAAALELRMGTFGQTNSTAWNGDAGNMEQAALFLYSMYYIITQDQPRADGKLIKGYQSFIVPDPTIAGPRDPDFSYVGQFNGTGRKILRGDRLGNATDFQLVNRYLRPLLFVHPTSGTATVSANTYDVDRVPGARGGRAFFKVVAVGGAVTADVIMSGLLPYGRYSLTRTTIGATTTTTLTNLVAKGDGTIVLGSEAIASGARTVYTLLLRDTSKAPILERFPYPFVDNGVLNVTIIGGDVVKHDPAGAASVIDWTDIGIVAGRLGRESMGGSYSVMVDTQAATNSSDGTRVTAVTRAGNLITIGGKGSNWVTNYFNKSLPVHTETGQGVCTTNPDGTTKTCYSRTVIGNFVTDYAFVSAYYDTNGQRWVVAMAGLSGLATQAICQLVVRSAPEVLQGTGVVVKLVDSDGNNVLETYQVVDGTGGAIPMGSPAPFPAG